MASESSNKISPIEKSAGVFFPSADGSLLGQRPDAGSRWEVTAWIQKAWTALPVQGAPPSQVSVLRKCRHFLPRPTPP